MRLVREPVQKQADRIEDQIKRDVEERGRESSGHFNTEVVIPIKDVLFPETKI